MLDGSVTNFVYSLVGLLVGAGFAAGGLFLCFRGIVRAKGSGSIRIGPVTIDFHDLAPGVAFAILGVVVIFLTRL